MNKKVKYLTSLVSIILIFSLIFSLYGCKSKDNNQTNQQPNDNSSQSGEYPTNNEISFGFIDHTMFNNFLNDGIYRCGTDFEPGDYYILSIYGAEALYDVSDSPNDFTWTYHRVMRKVTVKDGQYVSLPSAAILVSASEVDTNDWKKYGVFLVGVDLPEGDYKITTITDEYHTELNYVSGISGAYQICNNSPEDVPEDCTPLFDEQSYISVKNGQYVVINNARMLLNGIETSSKATETTTKVETTKTTTQSIPISPTQKIYEDAITATKSDLTGGTGKWSYKGIPLLSDDCDWIDSSLNKKGTVNQGAVYRKMAKVLWGSDFENKRFLYNYKDISELLLGFTPDTVDEYVVYGKNASEFIVMDNQLNAIMKKLKTLKSVSGTFDFDYKKFGKYSFTISDLSDCAKEMKISEEMLGFIFAMLDEYATEITFDGNSCHIEYTSI